MVYTRGVKTRLPTWFPIFFSKQPNVLFLFFWFYFFLAIDLLVDTSLSLIRFSGLLSLSLHSSWERKKPATLWSFQICVAVVPFFDSTTFFSSSSDRFFFVLALEDILCVWDFGKSSIDQKVVASFNFIFRNGRQIYQENRIIRRLIWKDFNTLWPIIMAKKWQFPIENEFHPWLPLMEVSSGMFFKN